MNTIKLLAMRTLDRFGHTIHPGEHFRVSHAEAPALVKAGDAAYRQGDEPKPKPAPLESKGAP